MLDITDFVTQWALMILVSVVLGTCLLIAVAFLRRWEQIRYVRFVHILQRKYRPALAEVLSSTYNPFEINALRELPMAHLEILLDPLFSKRKLPKRCLLSLQALCVELGLVELWQSRMANGTSGASSASGNGTSEDFPDRAIMRHLLRAKSIRNLGILRHRPSWPLLVNTLDDRHPDIQLVALRSLAALGAPKSFPVLRERLHAVVQGKSPSPLLQGLRSAMVNFDFTCVPALLPSLCHPDRHIRLHATEILRTMVRREAARQPGLALTQELLGSPMVESLVSQLAVDTASEIRARAAEVIVFLADPRSTPVLHNLLLDPQWLVRMRTVRALAQLRQASAPLDAAIRDCLSDPHWRVREAAIHTLISLGQKGKHHLYEHFLASPVRAMREQIVEEIGRAGMMSSLVEEYGEGTNGLGARMVEQLAGDATLLGPSGILRTLNPGGRQKFLLRFLPHSQSPMPPLEVTQPEVERAKSPEQVLEFPRSLAA